MGLHLHLEHLTSKEVIIFTFIFLSPANKTFGSNGEIKLKIVLFLLNMAEHYFLFLN